MCACVGGRFADVPLEPVCRARAVHDYKKAQDDELDLAEGDAIDVFKKVDEHWWLGRVGSDGAMGLLPCAYVQEVTGDDSGQAAAPAPPPAEPNAAVSTGDAAAAPPPPPSVPDSAETGDDVATSPAEAPTPADGDDGEDGGGDDSGAADHPPEEAQGDDAHE